MTSSRCSEGKHLLRHHSLGRQKSNFLASFPSQRTAAGQLKRFWPPTVGKTKVDKVVPEAVTVSQLAQWTSPEWNAAIMKTPVSWWRDSSDNQVEWNTLVGVLRMYRGFKGSFAKLLLKMSKCGTWLTFGLLYHFPRSAVRYLLNISTITFKHFYIFSFFDSAKQPRRPLWGLM